MNGPTAVRLLLVLSGVLFLGTVYFVTNDAPLRAPQMEALKEDKNDDTGSKNVCVEDENVDQNQSYEEDHEVEVDGNFTIPSDLYFIIYTYGFTETSGGATVLHLLGHKLNTLFAHRIGRPLAYLVPYHFPDKEVASLGTNPGYFTPLLPHWLDASKGVAIYPEITHGNPLGAHQVVRWILYYPGRTAGPSVSQFDAKDLIACYWKGYCDGFEPDKYTKVPLEIVDYNWNYFLNLNEEDEKRSGVIVFRAGKENWGLDVTRKDTTMPAEWKDRLDQLGPMSEMDRHQLKRTRLERYSKAKMFISFDMATFRSVEAAMAGALSVVVPLPGVAADEWRAKSGPDFRSGIAYGLDNLDFARKTMKHVMPRLRVQEARHDTNVINMVRAVVERMSKKTD